jgi:hypothetical protein
MHAFFHTKAAQRRLHLPLAATARKAAAPSQSACLMQMTVETASVTTLRQMAARICGDALQFIRIEACEHGARMKVWLCIGQALVAPLMEALMRALPGAEFGRFSAAQAGKQRGAA